MWETYVGTVPKGLVINQSNGVNETDNRLCNLELCTYKENSQHAVLLGLNNPCLGEDNGMSKLKEEEECLTSTSYYGKVIIMKIEQVFIIYILGTYPR